MAIIKHLITVVFALLGIVIICTNAAKIYNGCPSGQVLIKSLATYECISR